MKCEECKGKGTIFVKTGVTQGQDYGPETEGYNEKCLDCNGTGDSEKKTAAEEKIAALRKAFEERDSKLADISALYGAGKISINEREYRAAELDAETLKSTHAIIRQ